MSIAWSEDTPGWPFEEENGDEQPTVTEGTDADTSAENDDRASTASAAEREVRTKPTKQEEYQGTKEREVRNK